MGVSQAIQSHVALHKAGIRQILAWIKVVCLAEFLRRLLPSTKSGVFESQDAVRYEVAGVGLFPELADLDSLVNLPGCELIVDGSEIKLLPLARAATQLVGLTDSFFSQRRFTADLMCPA